MEYIFVQDEDTHWFRIPKDQKDRFNKLMRESYESEDFDLFEKEFSGYMIGCHPSIYEG